MISEILDKKLAIQDSLISFLEVSIQLKKLSNKVDDIIAKLEEEKKECDKIVSDFEKDMEKEMLDDQKKNIKV
tara:strand:+ start:627 stop:845 length:219 start_codon:yes stop_codon:yes gene_type:complete